MISRLRTSPDAVHLGLMLALTFSTGVVDAVGFLGLDRVFTGNMTGNVVILAMALTRANGLPIVGPVVALLLFLLGATIAGRVLRKQPAGWSPRTTVLLAVVAVILIATTITALATSAPRNEIVALAITGALGVAMGMQGGTARQIGVKDVTTVVVTSTLVGLAFDSRFAGRNPAQQWKRRLGAVVLIAAGAATGALLLRSNLALGVLLAAVVTLVVAVIGHIARPHSTKQ
ncbi:MAG: DUF1275 domain-containing protein [Microbacteriaceae bacterium]|nr:DUF1275 domain-containing protein [Microbacteriaceae bacterium]